MENRERLRGLIAATFTPMKPDGNINYDEIAVYADMIAQAPIEGVFVNGTTAEFASLTVEERKLIFERWVKEARGRFKVICHVGATCQRDCMALASHAAENGAYAVGAIAPFFFKPSTVNDLIKFFAPVAEAAGNLPFYYYNMPSMSGVNLPVDKFLEEGRKVMPNLAGTKFTHNNLMEMGACIALDNGSFEVLHGYDEILISGIAMGAIAGIGSTYNYIPEVYDGIFRLMAEDNVAEARKLQQISIKVVEVLIKHGGGVRCGKAILRLIGLDMGQCRAPITEVSDAEYEEIKKELKLIGIKIGTGEMIL